MPGNKCSNCIAYSYSCTYVEAAKVSDGLVLAANQCLLNPCCRNAALRKGEFNLTISRRAVDHVAPDMWRAWRIG